MNLFKQLFLKPHTPLIKVTIACPHGSPEPVRNTTDLVMGGVDTMSCPLCNFVITITYVGDIP